jgi:hypothetical protein
MLRAWFGGRPRPARPQPRDYFELLGVPRSCSADDARAAADALLARLEPTGDADASAEVRQVVLDARDVLGEDALRTAYLHALGGIGDPAGETSVPVAPPSPE